MGLQGSSYICAFFALALATTVLPLSASLSPYYYDKTCPNALKTIKSAVEEAVREERRMGASLLRLHFHDCFVLGCDASILLDPAPTIDSEKNAIPNKGSIRGYEVIDKIKSRVDKACGKPVVSCADIVAVAARDSVVALGGPTWQVPLGRRDSTTASRTLANRDIPSPFLDLPGLIDNFKRQGLDVKDLVALSGGHTLGFARCKNFRERIYNETNIDPIFARQRQATCPRKGHDGNLAPLDPTPALFDTKYFSSLVMRRGLLHSDQELFKYGGQTDWLVSAYARYAGAFSKDFVESMIKMGNIKLLTGTKGQIRVNCRKVNSHV